MYDQIPTYSMPEGDVEVAFGNRDSVDSVQVSFQSFFFHSPHHLAGFVVWRTLEGPFLFKSGVSLLVPCWMGVALCRRVLIFGSSA